MKKETLVLAYSGGLDTSYSLKKLSQEGYEIHAVSVNTGGFSQEEIDTIEAKAYQMGAFTYQNINVLEDFYQKIVKYLLFGNVLKNNTYPLSVSAERIIQAIEIVNYAKKVGAKYIAHGSTGAGNDQVRFELSAYSLNPDIKIIAPWREWELNSRDKLLSYASSNNISVDMDKKNTPPYSMDANLLHISYEGKALEDPWSSPPEDMWRWTTSPKNAPDKPEELEIEFFQGDPISINGKKMSAANLLESLNDIGAAHGIGRLDIIENRYVGMKSRGCYETPGGTIILHARRAMESITLDREVAHLKTEIMPKYANMIYNGFWWSPERENLQKFIDETQKNVNGFVRISLYKGNVIIEGRKSDNDSLYNVNLATFDEDEGAFNHKDAEGFIVLNALRLKNSSKK